MLEIKPAIPVAVIEAKRNKFSIGRGMPQAQGYSEMFQVPFAFSSNGDGFLFHDKTVTDGPRERKLTLDQFPSPADLWHRYCQWRGISDASRPIVEFDDHADGSGKGPRYYQKNAINRTIEAIATGQNRGLLVMATGTGKTYTAFQIIWRLWKSGTKKRILFLADRNILIDQTMVNDFKPFKIAMARRCRPGYGGFPLGEYLIGFLTRLRRAMRPQINAFAVEGGASLTSRFVQPLIRFSCH